MEGILAECKALSWIHKVSLQISLHSVLSHAASRDGLQISKFGWETQKSAVCAFKPGPLGIFCQGKEKNVAAKGNYGWRTYKGQLRSDTNLGKYRCSCMERIRNCRTESPHCSSRPLASRIRPTGNRPLFAPTFTHVRPSFFLFPNTSEMD